VRSRIALAALLVGAAFACPVDVAQAQYPYDDPGDAAPSPDSYERTLGPYGSWQTDPGFGRYWQPRVAAGWQPYSDGQWIWTAYGWTWVSNEPWSWTFHYGRWAYSPPRGWVWIPGTVWGPAWVSWVSYGGYIGWAPLSPYGSPGFNDFVFVRNYDFCAPRLRTAIVRRELLPPAVFTHWHDHVVRSPERRFIEEVSRHPVRVMRDRPDSTLPPWRRADRGRPDLDSPRRPGVADDLGRGPDRDRGRREPALRRENPPAREREHAERPWFRPPRGDRPRGDAPPAVQHPPRFDGDRRVPRSPDLAADSPSRRGGMRSPPGAHGGGGGDAPRPRPTDRGGTGRVLGHGSAPPAWGGEPTRAPHK
jgi:hypothetical protein